MLRSIGIDTTEWWTVQDANSHSWDALAAQILDGTRPRAPLVCPICGSKRGHACLHARGRSIGRFWLWCTACRSYLFERKRPPTGWINLPWLTMPECEYALPQCLLDRAPEVDAHWNAWVDGHEQST